MKNALLAAAAILALTAGSAMAASPSLSVKSAPIRPIHLPSTGVLYSQNSNSTGNGVDSQNFTSGSFGTGYNDAAADDFVVPAGKVWRVNEVDVSGLYFNGSGPASSEIVTFYKSKKGLPGAVAGAGADRFTLTCSDTAGSFACTLPTNSKGKALVKLAGGTSGHDYFVSVVANCSFVGGCGEWGWEQTSGGGNNPGVWEDPGNSFGTGCTTWTNSNTCVATGYSEYMFDLIGSGG